MNAGRWSSLLAPLTIVLAAAWFVVVFASHERGLRIAIGGLTLLCLLTSVGVARPAARERTT